MLMAASSFTAPVAAEEEWSAAIVRVCSDPAAIRVVFQPIVDLARGPVAGYELLTRFAGPPQASPDVWFGAAARVGLATAICCLRS